MAESAPTFARPATGCLSSTFSGLLVGQGGAWPILWCRRLLLPVSAGGVCQLH